MKTLKYTGIWFIAMLFSFRLIAQSNQKEQLVVPLSEPAKPFKLNVDLVFGSITVNSYSGKDILIDVQSNEKEDSNKQDINGMRRIGGHGGMDITAREKNNQVSVHSEIPNKAVRLALRIPKQYSTIKLSTVNDGNIIVNNVNAELEVSDVNGYIQLNNISGLVVANTINGDVKVMFKSLAANAAMAFTTLNGNVDVSFPGSLKANFKLKSDRGEIFTDFDLITNHPKAVASKSSRDGMYQVKMDDWVYGKVNGGGPEILMKNMNGNIYIRKSKN